MKANPCDELSGRYKQLTLIKDAATLNRSPAAAKQAKDSISITPMATHLLQAVAGQPSGVESMPFDMGKVAAIKTDLNNNSYKINPDNIIKGLLLASTQAFLDR